MTDLSDTADQRLVEYSDGTLALYTKGTDLQGGMESVQSLIDELGVSQEEAFRIKQLEPEDQILEITELRTLKDKPKKAQGGIIEIDSELKYKDQKLTKSQQEKSKPARSRGWTILFR